MRGLLKVRGLVERPKKGHLFEKERMSKLLEAAGKYQIELLFRHVVEAAMAGETHNSSLKK